MYLYTCYLVYCRSFICTYIPAGIYSKSIVYSRSFICTYIPAGIYSKSIVTVGVLYVPIYLLVFILKA